MWTHQSVSCPLWVPCKRSGQDWHGVGTAMGHSKHALLHSLIERVKRSNLHDLCPIGYRSMLTILFLYFAQQRIDHLCTHVGRGSHGSDLWRKNFTSVANDRNGFWSGPKEWIWEAFPRCSHGWLWLSLTPSTQPQSGHSGLHQVFQLQPSISRHCLKTHHVWQT